MFNRPRASQLLPSLMPPVDVPGHPSYPSAHATESYLLSGCLRLVFETANGLPPGTVVIPTASLDALDRLAQRVARNREVLGLHYPSDSALGQKLAQWTLPLLKKCPSFSDLVSAAAAEWRSLAP
jgi:membrane-associated phospholipid phosphatase